jgi:uncharacterized membrane protein
MREEPGRDGSGRDKILGPGLLLGVGLGGFVDGILLHQILQWHHMLTGADGDTVGIATYPATTVPGLEVNTTWDGFFHTATWVSVVIGLLWLWRRTGGGSSPRPPSRLVGLLLAGWGIFNLVEGVIDHHVLQIHHVRAGPGQLWYDLGFLVLGAVLLVGGLTLHRAAGRTRPRPRTTEAPQRAVESHARGARE